MAATIFTVKDQLQYYLEQRGTEGILDRYNYDQFHLTITPGDLLKKIYGGGC